MTDARNAMIAELRQRIARIEGHVADREDRDQSRVCPTGFADVDAHLPGGGMVRGALHEIIGVGGVSRATATGFAVHLLDRLAGATGTVLWCLRARDLYGPGLVPYGFDGTNGVGRLIVARGDDADAVLWAMEEGLASGALAAVLGEPGRMAPKAALTAHRRLQLAAERHGGTALLLGDTPTEQTPAVSRWGAQPAPGGRWRIELSKCKGGRPGAWSVPAPDPLRHPVSPALSSPLGSDDRTNDIKTNSGPSNSGAVAAVSGDGPAAATPEAA